MANAPRLQDDEISVEEFFKSIYKQTEGRFSRLMASYHGAASFSFSAILQSLIAWRKRSMLDWTDWSDLGCTTADTRTQPFLDEKKIVRPLRLVTRLRLTLPGRFYHELDMATDSGKIPESSALLCGIRFIRMGLRTEAEVAHVEQFLEHLSTYINKKAKPELLVSCCQLFGDILLPLSGEDASGRRIQRSAAPSRSASTRAKEALEEAQGANTGPDDGDWHPLCRQG